MIIWRTLALAFLLLAANAAPTSAQQTAGIWVDTDAACGVSQFKDVDDCIALAVLANQNVGEFVGLSTIFGNASRPVVDGVVSTIFETWRHDHGSPPRVYSGARRAGDCAGNLAVRALQQALRRQRLTIIALGPFTNIACVLTVEPALANNVNRIIAVAGARQGHVFHPAEGAKKAMLFGHGPVARDFNVSLDKRAAQTIMATNIAITLTPYDVARSVEVSRDDLAILAATGKLGKIVARMSDPWLKTWRKYVGRDGFYPFDLMAVGAVLTPQAFVCQQVNAEMRIDQLINNSRFGPLRLLVGGSNGRIVTWCDALAPDGQSTLLSLLGRADR